ncbi:hypothetical protein V8C86DRAFT_3136630 [Haematococcus lacustris]
MAAAGDGAGVGKGRQIAGIILDNYCRGRRKAAWFSLSSDLCLDAQRDLSDLGAHITVINNVQTLDRETRALGLSQDFQEGCLFLTYSSLVSSLKGRSRLSQIVDWLGGPAFEGPLIFDECHKAKNWSAGGKEGGSSTKVAAAVLELQELMPRARVLYCSATGVSEVGNMAYLTRLGLWGEGTAFRDFAAFLDSMKKRGVSFMEMLAMEMKADGKFVGRGLSFRDAEFYDMEATLTPDQAAMYDRSVAVWRRLRQCLEHSLALTSTTSRDVWKTYWSAQQRFFKLLCVSIKVPAVVAEAQAALQAGQCVVIGLQTTGEAADAAVGLEPGPVQGFVSTTKELLVRFVRDHLPLHRTPQEQGPGGAQVPAAPSPPVPECVEMRDGLMGDVAELQLPPNFLDQIMDELGGPSMVCEMTGRRGRIVQEGRSGRYVYELRAKPESNEMDSLNVREKELFMQGKRLVAIISDAASTGISLHASLDAVNQRRRLHITIELPWSADKAIQQLGRTHRSNQAQGPIYKLVSSRIGGEKRFAAAVARRLQSLGALTRGDRRAASGIDLSEQNFDSPLGRRSLRRMYDAIVAESSRLPPGVRLADVLRESVRDKQGPGVTDEELDALLTSDDSQWEASTITLLHAQLREYVDVMGVGVESPNGAGRGRPDSVPEDHAAARSSGGFIATGGSGAPASGKDKAAAAAGKDAGDVKRFLNRLLGLPLADQNLLFSYFAATLAAEISAAKRDGRWTEGLADLAGSRITRARPPRVLWRDPLGSSALSTLRNDFTVDRGLPFQSALAMLQHEAQGLLLPPQPSPAKPRASQGQAVGPALPSPEEQQGSPGSGPGLAAGPAGLQGAAGGASMEVEGGEGGAGATGMAMSKGEGGAGGGGGRAAQPQWFLPL